MSPAPPSLLTAHVLHPHSELLLIVPHLPPIQALNAMGPPYKPPDDAQFIVVLKPPCEVRKDGEVNYKGLEYWLRALFNDQRAAKFIYEIEKNAAVIVELPSPEELLFPSAAYGEHSLRLGIKRQPWFSHDTGLAVIMPYNFENLGHPRDTQSVYAGT